MVAEKDISDSGNNGGPPPVRSRSAVGPPSERRWAAVIFDCRRPAVGPLSVRRRNAIGAPSGRRRAAVLSAVGNVLLGHHSMTLSRRATSRDLAEGADPTASDRDGDVRQMHINCLELLATTLGVQTFLKHKSMLSVLLRLDNTSATCFF